MLSKLIQTKLFVGNAFKIHFNFFKLKSKKLQQLVFFCIKNLFDGCYVSKYLIFCALCFIVAFL